MRIPLSQFEIQDTLRMWSSHTLCLNDIQNAFLVEYAEFVHVHALSLEDYKKI